jgi:RNA polymerase sigma-70 factor (ECF subfamily)
MSVSRPGADVESLLTHADWLRALATFLLQNPSEADDMVQETFVAALRSPPDPARAPRPWLGQVLRNLVRMGARGAARRRAREREALAMPPAEQRPADAVLERMQLQRKIAELVTALEEPYRTALLLRFFEGREPARIAEALNIPAGTVRWRIAEGLRRLRERLDQGHLGEGESWRAALAPLAWPGRGEAGPRGAPEPPPPSTAVLGSKLVLVGGGLAAVGVLGGALWLATGPTSPWPGRAGHGEAAAERSQSTEGIQERTPANKEEAMRNQAILRKTVVLFGLVLPALANAGDASKPLPKEEAVNTCIWYKEVAVKCKEELADYFASFAPAGTPPEKRARYRARALEEIVAEGTGPLEPRRAKCAVDIEKQPITYGDLALLKSCAAQAKDDCKAAVECAKSFARRGRGPK